MPSRADLAVPPPPPRTFDEAFSENRLTPDERVAMVWHLAAFRARKTVEALLPQTDTRLALGFDPRDVLRSTPIKSGDKNDPR